MELGLPIFALVIALLSLLFSFYTWKAQTRLSLEEKRTECKSMLYAEDIKYQQIIQRMINYRNSIGGYFTDANKELELKEMLERSYGEVERINKFQQMLVHDGVDAVRVEELKASISTLRVNCDALIKQVNDFGTILTPDIL